MEIKSEFVVLRDPENGRFVSSYENRGHALSYEAGYCMEVEQGLSIPIEYFSSEEKRYVALANLLDCELVKVEATYNLTLTNGEDISPAEVETAGDRLRKQWEQVKEVLDQLA